MSICVVPGSFDPFTLGHLDVVRRASRLFDEVYVAIMINPDKTGKFSFAERKEIAELSCAGIDNVRVITAEGLLCELCEALGAVAVVKGIRNSADYVYEADMAGMNRKIDPDIETVWLPASPGVAALSSTFARELMHYGKPLDGVLHPSAIGWLAERKEKQNG